MDDRTTIASGLFLAWFQAMGAGRKRIEAAEMREAARICVNNADALIDSIENSPTAPAQSPHPKPPSSGPRWRKMTDLPEHDLNVLVTDLRGHDYYVAFWSNSRKCWLVEGAGAMCVAPTHRWLDLNGFTPEVSE